MDPDLSPEARRLRFKELLDYLEQLNENEPEAFDLDTWMGADSRAELLTAMREWPSKHQKGEKLNCGTAACLVGHLPVIFPQAFYWKLPRTRHSAVVQGVVYRHTVPRDVSHYTGPWALTEYFGGTSAEWQDIIYSDSYCDEGFEDDEDVPLEAVLNRLTQLYVATYGNDQS